MGRAIIDGCTMHVPDIEMLDPVEFAAGRALAARLGFRAMLVAPMLREGAAIGGILLRRVTPGAFTQRQIELAESLAAQAVIAIENARLFTGLRESLEQQTATADILRVISQSPTDVQPVLSAVAKAALRFCGAPDALISMRDGDDWVTTAHEGPLTATIPLRRRLSRGSAAGRCIMDSHPVEIVDMEGADAAGFPESVERARLGGWRAALAAPMLREGAAIGAIFLRRPEPGPFTPRQLQLLEAFAAQAVIAVENVRLFTELDARNAELHESLEQQTATAEVLATINANPGELGPVFDAMLNKAMLLCGATVGELRTYDGQDFRQVASRGMPDAYVDH